MTVPPCPHRAPTVPPAHRVTPCPRAPLHRHGARARPHDTQHIHYKPRHRAPSGDTP